VVRSRPACVCPEPWQLAQRLWKIGSTSAEKLTTPPAALLPEEAVLLELEPVDEEPDEPEQAASTSIRATAEPSKNIVRRWTRRLERISSKDANIYFSF
jgi:hypothetical protein